MIFSDTFGLLGLCVVFLEKKNYFCYLASKYQFLRPINNTTFSLHVYTKRFSTGQVTGQVTFLATALLHRRCHWFIFRITKPLLVLIKSEQYKHLANVVLHKTNYITTQSALQVRVPFGSLLLLTYV
jgi:hypothetical protein